MQLQPELREAWESLQNVSNDHDLSQWTAKYGDRSTSNRESQILEYKEEPHSFGILKATCALANSIGGIILVGVQDELTKADPHTNTQGGLNILGTNRRNYSNVILKMLRSGFYYSFPFVEVKYLSDTRVTAILVYGNEQELLTFRSEDNALHGYRRKSDNSDPMGTEEILAVASRWQLQRSIIMDRYALYPKFRDYGFRNNRGTSLLVNALPVPPFSYPIRPMAFAAAANEVSLHLPGFRFDMSTSAQRAFFKGYKNISFEIQLLDSGFYEISSMCRVGSKTDPSEISKDDYIRLLALSIYSCTLISYTLDNSSSWAIQGKFTHFFSDDEPQLVHQSQPVFFDLMRLVKHAGSPFPRPLNSNCTRRDVIRVLRHCSRALDLDLLRTFDRKARLFDQMRESWTSVSS